MTKVKDMLDTVRQLTVRAISEDRDIPKFTAHKIIIPMSKGRVHLWVPSKAYYL